MAFYEVAKKQFGLDTHCDNMFHNDHRCYFYPDMRAAGPFTTAQWALFFLAEDYSEIALWFMQNRDDFDIMIHPNSGYELEDHKDWPLWAGRMWPMDYSIFEH